jgi:hypothetical protein
MADWLGRWSAAVGGPGQGPSLPAAALRSGRGSLRQQYILHLAAQDTGLDRRTDRQRGGSRELSQGWPHHLYLAICYDWHLYFTGKPKSRLSYIVLTC